ncbi:hypothetical protein [Streptomyces sp. V1I1]|uniref:hypothetical protein n=1 Tax=Streptomyces sp. V1I1 TaxID=3042272 RepID=UPI0027D84DDC|nr:hypothetical protein [Streptomyces sp. V1I1]
MAAVMLGITAAMASSRHREPADVTGTGQPGMRLNLCRDPRQDFGFLQLPWQERLPRRRRQIARSRSSVIRIADDPQEQRQLFLERGAASEEGCPRTR